MSSRLFAKLQTAAFTLCFLTAVGGVFTSAQTLQGNIRPIHDPSLIRQSSTYYLFTTDGHRNPTDGYLPIRCSTDKVTWQLCATVFQTLPTWLASSMPNLHNLWAPDISFFNGQYHLYYAASVFGTQQSIIALATNTTLDSTSPAYHWIDHGPILFSKHGDDYNAIDPNIFIDTDHTVWLTYGSFWNGIDQLQIDPATGTLLKPLIHHHLAARPNTTPHAIEGPSLVHHGNFYYLFVSLDSCCTRNPADATYKQAVGRAKSPHGPFYSRDGTPMLNGGATILLQTSDTWHAPGGGTAYIDPTTGESLLVYHALSLDDHGASTLRLQSILWIDNWPTLQ